MEWHEEYNKIKHNSKNVNKDWGDFHEFWVNKSMIFIDEQRTWAYTNRDEYEKWYMQRGMVTVYVRANEDQVLEQPHENPTPDQLENLPYQDRGYRDTRLVCIYLTENVFVYMYYVYRLGFRCYWPFHRFSLISVW